MVIQRELRAKRQAAEAAAEAKKQAAETALLKKCNIAAEKAVDEAIAVRRRVVQGRGKHACHHRMAPSCISITALHYSAVHCTAQQTSALHCTALHCTA